MPTPSPMPGFTLADATLGYIRQLVEDSPRHPDGTFVDDLAEAVASFDEDLSTGGDLPTDWTPDPDAAD
jgi:hypothetical protein